MQDVKTHLVQQFSTPFSLHISDCFSYVGASVEKVPARNMHAPHAFAHAMHACTPKVDGECIVWNLTLKLHRMESDDASEGSMVPVRGSVRWEVLEVTSATDGGTIDTGKFSTFDAKGSGVYAIEDCSGSFNTHTGVLSINGSDIHPPSEYGFDSGHDPFIDKCKYRLCAGRDGESLQGVYDYNDYTACFRAVSFADADSASLSQA